MFFFIEAWSMNCVILIRPLGKTPMKFESKYKTSHSWKCIWKCHMRNDGHFVRGDEVKRLRQQHNGVVTAGPKQWGRGLKYGARYKSWQKVVNGASPSTTHALYAVWLPIDNNSSLNIYIYIMYIFILHEIPDDFLYPFVWWNTIFFRNLFYCQKVTLHHLHHTNGDEYFHERKGHHWFKNWLVACSTLTRYSIT